MFMTPSSFTYENLSSLKFKELQKLSAQFHVNKRWAKKQELVENLLALNKKEKVNDENDEKEWRDGSSVFNNLPEKSENEVVDRRLTFSVSTKSNVEKNEGHLTFDIPQNGKKLLEDCENSRKTYDVPPSKSELADAAGNDSRATFDIPVKKNLIEEIDPRATFEIPQNNKKLLNQNDTKKGVKKADLGNIKLDITVKGGEQERNEKGKTQVKTLTIPYARITRRTRKDGETSKIDNTPIKMSKKSINIKKSTRLPVTKNDLIKSPALSSIKNSVKKQTIIQSFTKPQTGKIPQSKLPIRLQLNEEKEAEKGNKENVKQILRKGLTKSGDEPPGKNSNLLKVNFRTPPPSLTKASKTVPIKKTPLRKEIGNGAPTPGNKSVTKPITATKMPDFNKIHKRQFEQMDSLHDYLKKKEDRIRKLFGTPQPGQQLQNLNKTAPVFRFQSTAAEKENKGGDVFSRLTTPMKKKENISKSVQKEAFKSRLPPSKVRTDIKDKNRSHIHGVRTNKRFELQMKFRNM